MALPVFQAAGSQVTDTGGTITVPWPTHQADDIGGLIVQTANEAATISTNAADWTESAVSPQGTGPSNDHASTRLILWLSRATSSSMGAPVVGDPGNIIQGLIFTIRGCILTGDPFDVIAGDVEAATDTSDVVIPGATTTVADCLVALILAHGIDGVEDNIGDTYVNSDLANMLKRIEEQTASGKGGGLGVATGEKASAGAYGTTTNTLLVNHTQGRICIAFKPPAAAGSLLLPSNPLLAMIGR